MNLNITVERDDDRWLGVIEAIAGCMAYGATPQEAIRNVKALAFEVISDRLRHGEPVLDDGDTDVSSVAFSIAA